MIILILTLTTHFNVDAAYLLQDSGKAVKAMPDYFRARLDIETRIGDVTSVRHRTRLGLMSTMRFCGQHFASAAKLAVTLLIVVGGVRLRQNSDLISQRIDLIRSNSRGFLERRVVGPAVSILNDVVLNKKVAITDHAALKDSQRSLATMLDDFLTQYKPQMPSEERAKRVARLDMTDVSLEYEQELKKPMQNIMSGRIARLALIQGQFVKKELLVAMQAIDDLVNANQVNLQLLAVMPVIMIGFVVSSGIKALLTTARSFNRGSSRLVQTKQMVRRDLKNGFRTLERQLLVNAREVSPGTAASDQDTASTSRGRGRTMCILYRMHRTIMDKSELMGDDALVKQLLQDLSDLMTPNLLPERQIALLKLCQDNL
jgi:nuclear-control-of-ATPase protein 2